MSVGPSTSGFGFVLCKVKCTDETCDVSPSRSGCSSATSVTSTSIVRLWLEGDLSKSARSSGLGQVLKPLGEKRQAVKRCGEVCDRRRGVGRLGGERVRDPHRARIVIPPSP